jgi:hypothetical protein
MPRKVPPKTKPERPPLPFREWDFRKIPADDDTLLEATLFEYLRSSPLLEQVVAWQQTKAKGSEFERRLSYFVREFAVYRREPILGEPYHSDDSLLTNAPHDDDRNNLRNAAFELGAVFTERDLTMQEVISEIFERFSSGRIRLFLLRNLRCTLPPDVFAAQAHWICLRYDRFPKPWLTLPLSYTSSRSWTELMQDYALLNGKDAFIQCEVPEYRFFDNPQVMPVLAFVNLTRPAKEIRKQMEDWASRTFRMRRTGPKATTGWLQRLSVYRLRRMGKLTANDAMEVINKRRREKPGATTDALPSTRNEQNWSNLLGEAESDLQGDFVPAIYSSFGRLAPFG